MKRQVILSILAVVCIIAVRAKLDLAIYRNDGGFNYLHLCEGDTVCYTGIGDSIRMIIPDLVAGKAEIPVLAIDSCVIRSEDIPVLRFSFPDYPNKTMLWEKELYVNAILNIEGNGMVEDQEGLSLQMKGRGNSTWTMAKKPMRLKFAKKTSICGFRKAKNFVLLNNLVDPSMMRNPLAMWLAQKLGVPFANTSLPCQVFINGSYAGAYTLTEKVGINGASVDIDEEQGALIELSVDYDEPYKFRSAKWDLPVMIKDPDFDELYEDDPEGLTPDERLALWEADFNSAEQLVAEGDGTSVFDIESAVSYYLLYNFIGNHEIGYPRSLYLHKKSLEEGEKYCFGPAWDFDVSTKVKYPHGAIASPRDRLWVPDFMTALIKTQEFKERYAEKLAELEEALPEFFEFFDSYARLIEPSAKLNGLRWPANCYPNDWIVVESSFNREEHVYALREWLQERFMYMKTQTF